MLLSGYTPKPCKDRQIDKSGRAGLPFPHEDYETHASADAEVAPVRLFRLPHQWVAFQATSHGRFGTVKMVNRMVNKPRIPTDLSKALADASTAKAQWSHLTPIARRDFISWIDSAKQLETRRRRIERACSMLTDGKRRPCCFSIVSLDLHKALAATPTAKSQWSDLTPIERRDFISWMDSAEEPEARRRRIEQACSMLASGKRRP